MIEPLSRCFSFEEIASAEILYVEDGALKYMGSKGTVAEIAPA